jgi:5-methylcytosine-specific restriction endonuclease McrA
MTGPADKRAAFLRLKELAGQGRLVPEKRRKFTGKERRAVHEAFEGRCDDCGANVGLSFEIDHRVPLFRGGKHEFANWQLLCKPCHAAKTGGEAKGNAKIRRIERRIVEGPKPAKLKGGARLKSRGFTAWRNMRGEIVRRPA